MKKIISMILCLTLLLSCALPVLAADGVPEAVMESTKSVVRIMSEYRKGYSTGSGFVIKNEPGEVLIVTNDHVVEDNPKKISVWVSEDRLVEAQIVVTTSGKDLCILRLMEDVDLKPLTLSEEEPRHGAAIYVVGYPGAGDILSDTQAHTSDSATITDGIISAIRTFTIEKGAQPVQLLQVNAAINAGNSGGPLFNTEGVVVGINTYKVNADSQGVFGSVAVSELWNLMEQYNIVIPEETEVAEATETAEAVPEEEKGESSLSLPVLIGAGVGCLVLVLLLILGSRKKKTGSRKTVVTLKTHLEQYPQGLGIAGAVSLLLPVAVQLRNLHNDGRLHLQVCPENILVEAEGSSLKEPTQQETGRYNSGFAAPEIYKGAGFGVTSDIYSFAAVLLYAVTGKVPGNSLQPETLEQDLALVEDAAFAAILRKAMASNLLDRTQSMQELIFGIAVYNTSAQEKPKPEKVAVPEKKEPAPKSEAVASQPADRRRNPSHKRKTKLLPIAVVLACGIIAVVLLWKPAENQEEAVDLQSTEQTENTVPVATEDAAITEFRKLISTVKIGDTVCLGAYEQDNNTANGKEAVEWIVLAKENNKILVISKYALDCQKYNTTHADVTWETSSLRKWLNNVFINNAFSPAEQELIATTTVSADKKTSNKTDPGNDTQDKIFLLSIAEAETYCSLSGSRKCIPTNYAIAQGVQLSRNIVDDNGKSTCCWWLRSPGNNLDRATYVYDGGGINNNGIDVHLKQFAVRPALWLANSAQQEMQYMEAEELLAVGETAKAAIAFGKLGDYKDARERSFELWADVAPHDTFYAGFGTVVAIKEDGSVISAGNGNDYIKPISEWTDIVSLSVGLNNVVGLKSDGTVVTSGKNHSGECNVENWSDIIAIAGGNRVTAGLRIDGTVVMAGGEHVDKNFAEFDVSGWENIIAISAGQHIVGLKEDGTVVATGPNVYGSCDVSDWSDIAAINANGGTIGIKSDGTVITTGFAEDNDSDVSGWKNIVDVGQDANYIVGLKADGTVVMIGAPYNTNWVMDTSGWTDIIAISAGSQIVGLKADGTVLSTGGYAGNDIPASDWTNIKRPN